MVDRMLLGDTSGGMPSRVGRFWSILLLGLAIQPLAVNAIRTFTTRQQALAFVTAKPEDFQGVYIWSAARCCLPPQPDPPLPPPVHVGSRLTGIRDITRRVPLTSTSAGDASSRQAMSGRCWSRGVRAGGITGPSDTTLSDT